MSTTFHMQSAFHIAPKKIQKLLVEVNTKSAG